jgi:hypothetical protein
MNTSGNVIMGRVGEGGIKGYPLSARPKVSFGIFKEIPKWTERFTCVYEKQYHFINNLSGIPTNICASRH